MNRSIVTNQHLSFSVLFPEVHQLVLDALTRQFPILPLRSLRVLLLGFAEILTQHVVSVPRTYRSRTSPCLDLMELRGSGGEKVEEMVFGWCSNLHIFESTDVVRIKYGKVFEFTRAQILSREHNTSGLSENDIAELTMILIKMTRIFYKGKQVWTSDEYQICRNLGRWFVVGAEI